jgi:ribosomal protein S18 acetylase RimI-like enzyme
MSLTLRRAVPTDVAVVTEFNARLAFETENKALDRTTLEAGVSAVLADSSRGQYYVAEDEKGLIVGQLLITTEWSDWRNGWFWWIQSVYVREEARQSGVFRALYEHVAGLAQYQGDVIGLRLYVERDNLRAQKTYDRLGMSTTDYLLLERCPL